MPLFLLCIAAQSQPTGPAVTKGNCSPAVSGSGNTIIVNACGRSKEEVEDIRNILRGILSQGKLLAEIKSQLNTRGVLMPDNLPDPPFTAGIFSVGVAASRENPFVVFGGNLIVLRESKCTLLTIDGEPVLTVEKSKGGLLLSGRLFSPSRRIVADLDKNDITINPNNTFRRRIQIGFLSVEDEALDEVLSVRFPNPSYLLISGTFFKGALGVYAAKDGLTFVPRRYRIAGGISTQCGTGYILAADGSLISP